jgi:hypothetical protein
MAAAPGAIGLTRVGAILALAGAIAFTHVRAIGAHHSVLPFDGVTKTTIEGTVARVLWQNPHTLIAVDVGQHRWTIESEGALLLLRLGWTSDSLKAGDTVTVTGARAKDGRRLMRCKTITIRNHSLPCFGGSDPGQTPERDDSRH